MDTCLKPDIQFIPVTTAALVDQVVELAQEIWTKHYTPIIGSKQVKYMLDSLQSAPAITSQLAKGMQYFLVRLDNDATEVVAYLAFELKEESRELFLSKIYVRPDFQRQGIGQACFSFLQAQALDSNCKEIRLTVNKNNHKAAAAYEKNGFVRSGSKVTDIGQGFVMDDFEYVCSL